MCLNFAEKILLLNTFMLIVNLFLLVDGGIVFLDFFECIYFREDLYVYSGQPRVMLLLFKE